MKERLKRAAGWFGLAVVLGILAFYEYMRVAGEDDTPIVTMVSPAPLASVTLAPQKDMNNPSNWLELGSIEAAEGEWVSSHYGPAVLDGGVFNAEGYTVLIDPVPQKNKNARKRWTITIIRMTTADASISEVTSKCTVIDDGRVGFYPGTCGSSTILFHIHQSNDARIFIENYDLNLRRSP